MDLNKGQAFRTGIFDSVEGLSRDINRLSGGKYNLFIVKSHHSLTAQNKPVLIPVLVALQAQTFAGIYDNSFAFIGVFISKHLVKPPWPLILTFCHLKHLLVDGNIFFYHAVNAKIIFHCFSAVCPVNSFNTFNRFDCLVSIGNQKTVLSVLDNFRHAAAVDRDNRGAAGHRFNNGKAERFVEIYGMQQCGSLAQKITSFFRISAARIDDLPIINKRLYMFFEIVLILNYTRHYKL